MISVDEIESCAIKASAEEVSERDWHRYLRVTGPAAILELIAEVRRLREDAERYRWLRDGEKDVFCVIGSNGPWGECGHQEIYDDRLDSTIDEARAKEKP